MPRRSPARTMSMDREPMPASRGGAWVDGTLLLAAEVIVLVGLAASLATRAWQDRMWIGFVLVALAAVVWLPELLRRRFRRWWFAYVVGIYVYTLARAYADDTAIGTKVDYVISMERTLMGGNPGVWLQERFFDSQRLDALDYAAVALHWSFFFSPHALAVAIAIFQRRLFGFYTTLVVGTMYVGLVLFYLVPTAPPWYAGSIGAIDTFRVMDFVGGTVDAEAYESLYAALGEPNSFAAMPSAHMAVTFCMFLYCYMFARPYRWWLLAYSAFMGLALVYMAEHYVVDLVAGLACAMVAYAAAAPLAGRHCDPQPFQPILDDQAGVEKVPTQRA